MHDYDYLTPSSIYTKYFVWWKFVCFIYFCCCFCLGCFFAFRSLADVLFSDNFGKIGFFICFALLLWICCSCFFPNFFAKTNIACRWMRWTSDTDVSVLCCSYFCTLVLSFSFSFSFRFNNLRVVSLMRLIMFILIKSLVDFLWFVIFGGRFVFGGSWFLFMFMLLLLLLFVAIECCALQKEMKRKHKKKTTLSIEVFTYYHHN